MSFDIEKTADVSEFTAINVYEDIVKDSVLLMIKHLDMCSCSKCIADSCAIVLNQIMPKYVTTKKGELLAQLPQAATASQTEIIVKVVKALGMVKKSPNH